MKKIDKEKFIRDIKSDLNIKPREKECFTNYKENNFNIDYDEIAEVFNKFFKNGNDDNNPNNIYIDRKINKLEAINGCNKTIKYYKIINENKKEKCKIRLKFSKGITDGQKVVLEKEGNNNGGKIGNLVINIKVNGGK